MQLSFKNHTFDLSQSVMVMGILNVTPDSFSDGQKNFAVNDAVSNALEMIEQGADIIDIGGESTRPGAKPVSQEDELNRVIPVIRAIREQNKDILLSIDTWKSTVAKAALEEGVNLINDISACHRDPVMVSVASDYECGLIIMHMQGTPQTMQNFTCYKDMIFEINDYFKRTIKMLVDSGVNEHAIVIDPGIGFSKTAEQNLSLIKELDQFNCHGRPILLGASRKSFIGKTLNKESTSERLWGTAVANSYGIVNGARIIRVHDVKEMRDVCDMTLAIKYS